MFGFNFGNKTNSQDTEIEISFPLQIDENKFIEWYVKLIYDRILFDCRDKSAGIKEKYDNIFYDSYVVSQMPQGLISLIVDAMYSKQILHLVYKTEVVSKATQEEKDAIDAAIKSGKPLKNAVAIDFRNFTNTDLLKVYAGMLYKALETSNTGMNMSQSVILKMKDYRGTISVATSGDAAKQGRAISRGVKRGKGVLIDAGDTLELPTFDISTTEKSVIFINGMTANALGLPLSYINGALTTGISTTGEADEIAVQRGLVRFFYSIFKPIFDGLTGEKIKFKFSNWRLLQSAAELIKTLEMISEDTVTAEVKQKVIANIFDGFIKESDKAD